MNRHQHYYYTIYYYYYYYYYNIYLRDKKASKVEGSSPPTHPARPALQTKLDGREASDTM